MKLFSLLLLSSGLWAQNETISVDRWLVNPGDDPTFAAAVFDDSGWKAGPVPQRTETRGGVASGQVRWFRATVREPSWWSGQNLSVGMGPVEDAYELYVNGVLVGRFGVVPPPGATVRDDWQAQRYSPRHFSFPIPAAVVRSGSLTIAVRVWSFQNPRQRNSVTGGDVQAHAPVLGLREAVALREELDGVDGFLRVLPGNFLWLLIFSCGLFCVWLYRQWRQEKALLWLGLALAFNGAVRITTLPAALGMVAANSVTAFALSWGTAFWIHFFYCFLLAELLPPLRRAIRLASPVVAFASLLSLAASYFPFALLNAVAFPATEFGSFTQAGLGVAALWHQAARRQWAMAVIGAAVALRALMNASAQANRGLMTAGNVSIQINTIGNAVVALVLAGILYARYRRRSARQREAELDLAAARRVQDGLLASDRVDYPGFLVDKAYEPAQEVGGDFYQLIPDADGSLLVVTGDVSGKGLKAAMLVATVIGALGDLSSREPARVLEHLNRSLYGRAHGGFITCCCALFRADGSVAVANAGHLSPYCEREEIPVEGGLPLGITADAEYGQTVVEGGTRQFAFLSDGVVEAAKPDGELFGFERTREISGKSAGEIAAAAQAWGQNDDITVVTVRRDG